MSTLSITRRWNEEVCIGDDIVVRVSRIKGNQVILAITAPDNVRIDRRELRQKIDAEKGKP